MYKSKTLELALTQRSLYFTPQKRKKKSNANFHLAKASPFRPGVLHCGHEFLLSWWQKMVPHGWAVLLSAIVMLQTAIYLM